MPRVPLAWLAEWVDLPEGTTSTTVGAEQLAADLARVGLEDEGLHGAAVTGPLVVGRVVSLAPEPQKNGKTINWCAVDVGALNDLDADGGRTVPRGIVCGAHNFAAGDHVVVALPGAVLPGPFAIAARKTYGHVSDGMICSERELGLGEAHDGIIVLEGTPAPGTDAIELLGLGEQTLEINVTPDRGYCFSLRGVAREYSHATGATFRDPAQIEVPVPSGAGFGVVIADDAPLRGQAGADRFVARIVRGVAAAGPSPMWMQRRLTQAGMRPISLAVDVTNYVMLELGQPLHAYDLAGLVGPIVVRRARAGETLTTLDDVVRRLDPEDLLITDGAGTGDEPGSRVLGIAGVMGGASSEVSPTTTDVLIEGAHFDTVSVARTSRRHKLASEASRRFERGVDPELAPVAVQRVIDLLIAHGGGVADPTGTDVDQRVAVEPILFSVDLPTRIVGVEYPADVVRGVLELIGCAVQDTEPGFLRVVAPSWRPDLTEPIDLVEEVARLRGYDQIPSVLPVAPSGHGLTPAQQTRRSVARSLAESGLVEVLTYPFVSPTIHDSLGLAADDPRRVAARLANPLSDEHPELRTSVLATLVEAGRANVGRGMTDLGLFEIGLVTRPVPGTAAAGRPSIETRPSDDEIAHLRAAVPPQPRRVAGLLTGNAEPAGWWGAGRRADHTDAIAAVQRIAGIVGVPLTITADPDHAPWHPGRCARFTLADGTLVGHAGELNPKVVAALDLPTRSAAFEVDLDVLLDAAPVDPRQAVPLSTFPIAKEDIALVVDVAVPAADVFAAVQEGAGPLLEELRLFDVYTGAQVGEGKKSLAFSLRLRATDRTLTAQDAIAVREAAVAEATRRVGALLRGA
ncbi:phenylalanine--tRNA ligase subunit beta [Pengzhenrongella frigida]|uniref:Phenylalanine--tRNA ligase beta subunit n=1 Tax=Pengzhenrongella frigida TaxID=1259133 RepID=A0A4Q5N2V9_9MICO|nr:phenylalanine--tRNA ligase subunit beta [Cellulomonas sp. HLT2-17]RYV52519.1 phenylalanine--tRNA ligase subunit beta [Cellulomonas sp. HLT2-17]